MIAFWDGQDYPFEVRFADILFISGCVPVDRSYKLPFEHVVFAAESKMVEREDDLLRLDVYGLPESEDHGAGQNALTNIHVTTGQYWQGKPELGVQIGSAATVWNLGVREDRFTARQAKHFVNFLAFKEGSLRFRSGPQFAVDRTLTKNIETNCLGFVCSFLEYFGLPVLRHQYPFYENQHRYPRGVTHRDYPSPGHLAHALWLKPSLQYYCPASVEEAEKYARVDETLQDVVNGIVQVSGYVRKGGTLVRPYTRRR